MKFFIPEERFENKVIFYWKDKEGNLILNKEIDTILSKEILNKFFKENREFRKKEKKWRK